MADETQDLNITPPKNRKTEPKRHTGVEIGRESELHAREPDTTDIWKERYLRLQADLDNTKKRLARSSAQELEAQKEALLRDVLPVADALDLALLHTSQEEDNRSILQGIDLIRDMLNKFFAEYDVTVIDAWGKPFDPRVHEALGVIRQPNLPPSTVARVERRGYLYRDKLLRPAQVVVTSK
jgi:molecular chaperone GrpE